MIVQLWWIKNRRFKKLLFAQTDRCDTAVYYTMQQKFFVLCTKVQKKVEFAQKRGDKK